MTYYYVSNIAGIATSDKNLEVTMHDANKRTITFNTPQPALSHFPCNITVEVSRADTTPDNPDFSPINTGQVFTLLEQYGPVKYGY